MHPGSQYLATLARLVHLCRRPARTCASARDALRLLVSRAQERPLVLTVAAPGEGGSCQPPAVYIDGAPPDGVEPEALAALVAQLHGHQVRRLEIRQHAPTAELANLVRWLAREPGARGRAGVAARQALAAFGLWHVEVTFVGEESLDEVLAHDHRAGVPRQVVERYIEAARTATEPRTLARALAGLDALVDAYAATGEACPVAAALIGLMTLSEGADRWPTALRAPGAASLAAVHERLSVPMVACLAAQRLAEIPAPGRPALVKALHWLGAPGVAALVAHLMASDQLAVRRVYYDALVGLRTAIPLLTDALGHPQWFIVRNAACLLGDMGAVEADVDLATVLDHAEPRVREAAAAALLQLGTPVANQALARRLCDTNPTLRYYAARGVARAALSATAADEDDPEGSTTDWLARQGAAARPGGGDPVARAVVPLATALASESDVEVQVAILSSLGRLGTRDAIQRLRLAVRPDPTRSSAFRVAALEALAEAEGALAQPVVEALSRDPDPEVQQAAARLAGLFQADPLAERSGVGG